VLFSIFLLSYLLLNAGVHKYSFCFYCTAVNLDRVNCCWAVSVASLAAMDNWQDNFTN